MSSATGKRRHQNIFNLSQICATRQFSVEHQHFKLFMNCFQTRSLPSKQNLVSPPKSDSELLPLAPLHKSLTKRPKWLQKHSQNVHNGSQHDFSLNASQTRATVVLSRVETIKMGFIIFSRTSHLFFVFCLCECLANKKKVQYFQKRTTIYSVARK